MKNIRRRAADPTLKWASFGQNQQYRVAIRNQDTGEKQIIYEGFRQMCRLPAGLRLSPDQLAYRVESRSADDPTAPYRRKQNFTAIPRLGEDVDQTAPDRLARPEVVGATDYRFLVRDALSGDVLVDMTSIRPVFYLPAGQLRGRKAQWRIKPFVKGAWGAARWRPVSRRALKSALQRAERLVPLEADAVRPQPAEGRVRPAPGISSPTPGLLPDRMRAIVIPVTAAPDLGLEPDPEDFLPIQWSDGRGDGAVARLARLLEARGLEGWFFLDVEMGQALSPVRLARLAEELRAAGGRIGLYVGSAVLGGQGRPPAERLAAMRQGIADLGCADGVMLGDGPDRQAWLDALDAEGHAGVILSRAALASLPEWMRWRTAPFATSSRTIAFPTTTFLSTPAHARDRVMVHGLDNRHALAAAAIGGWMDASASLSAHGRLAIIELDPLRLLDRRRSRDRAAMDLWNNTLRQTLPDWLAAGWKRSGRGFRYAAGLSEIQTELLTSLLDGVAATQVGAAEWASLFSADQARRWLAPAAYEAILEQRRGVHVFRSSAVRRYDNAYRLAVRAAP